MLFFRSARSLRFPATRFWMFSGSKSFNVRKSKSTMNSVASSPAVVSRWTEGLNLAKASLTLSIDKGASSSSATSFPTRSRVIGRTLAVVSVGTGRAAGVTPFRITSILGISVYSLGQESLLFTFAWAVNPVEGRTPTGRIRLAVLQSLWFHQLLVAASEVLSERRRPEVPHPLLGAGQSSLGFRDRGAGIRPVSRRCATRGCACRRCTCRRAGRARRYFGSSDIKAWTAGDGSPNLRDSGHVHTCHILQITLGPNHSRQSQPEGRQHRTQAGNDDQSRNDHLIGPPARRWPRSTGLDRPPLADFVVRHHALERRCGRLRCNERQEFALYGLAVIGLQFRSKERCLTGKPAHILNGRSKRHCDFIDEGLTFPVKNLLQTLRPIRRIEMARAGDSSEAIGVNIPRLIAETNRHDGEPG